MKKILFLILFLTGINPVFKNNALHLSCSQVFGQESANGEEEVIICPRDKVSEYRMGDWVTTETCTYDNEGGIATNDCVETCNSVDKFDPEVPQDPCNDPFNTDPSCNPNCSTTCPYGQVLNQSCGCDPEPCYATCGEGFRQTVDCGCEPVPPPCSITYCPQGYREVNCSCIPVVITPPVIPDPCNSAATAAGVKTTNLLNNTIVKTAFDNLPSFTLSDLHEYAFDMKNINGTISTTAIRQLSSTGGSDPDFTASVIADLHTHAINAYAPSAQDLKALNNKRNLVPSFTTTYVSSYDGNVYAMYIDDPNKLNNFINNNQGMVGADNNFAIGTTVGDSWRNTITELKSQGYTPQEAQTRATALVLQDAGVTLLKSNATNIDFKKIDLRIDATLSDGTKIYSSIDCNN